LAFQGPSLPSFAIGICRAPEKMPIKELGKRRLRHCFSAVPTVEQSSYYKHYSSFTLVVPLQPDRRWSEASLKISGSFEERKEVR